MRRLGGHPPQGGLVDAEGIGNAQRAALAEQLGDQYR